MKKNFLLLPAIAIILFCCTKDGINVDLNGEVVNVTFIHTADIHSRILPYRMHVSYSDQLIGMKQENEPFGGAARGVFIIKREKAKSERVLHLDSGDYFQGAPIFNFFNGELELKVLSSAGCDVTVLGNHEFDGGSENLADKLKMHANFPVLAANFIFENSKFVSFPNLGKVIAPFTIFNLKGLKVGVIGMANVSTMHSIYETGNDHGITPLETTETAQFYIDLLKPQVNLIVVLSHLGITDDELLIKGTTGIDVVLGGHHHIVINPPKLVEDCQTDDIKEKKGCEPRKVIMAHSGAFFKYVGRLDVAVKQREDDPDDWEIISQVYKLFHVDATVPEDGYIKEFMEIAVEKMSQLIDLNLIIGYAPDQVNRYGNSGGDSGLGNLVATSMWKRKGIEADFTLTNTTGIRDNVYPGPLTIDAMYQIFPFENTISTLFLSGREVIELFDYVARRSALRGCNGQAQIAGARIVITCGECDLSKRPEAWPVPMAGPCAYSVKINDREVIPDMQYSLATNNYIAKGGSGYTMLKKNTTQQDTGITQRDALIDYIRAGKPCGFDKDAGGLKECTTDSDCPSQFTCACDERYSFNIDSASCDDSGNCQNKGLCILSRCAEDLVSATFFGSSCAIMKKDSDINECICKVKKIALNNCLEISCIDANLNAAEDGRIKIIQGVTNYE